MKGITTMARGMIIGIAGPSASGKTAAATHIAQSHGAYRTKYSDVLIAIATARRIPLDKASLQHLSTTLRHDHGEDYLTRELHKRLERVPNKIVVIEGNRRNVDIDFLLSLAEEQGKDLLLFYIDADYAMRLGRMNTRLIQEGKALISKEEFDVLENNECEAELPLVCARILKYGVVIDNTKLSLEELKTKIDERISVEIVA